MLPLLIVGIFLVLLSFFIGSEFGEAALGGQHPTLEFWTFWIGVACVVISIVLVLFALGFLAFLGLVATRD